VSPPTPRRQDGREHHAREIDTLTRLIESEGWQWLRRDIERRQVDIVAAVMASSTPLDDVQALRHTHAALADLLTTPERTRAIHESALNKA